MSFTLVVILLYAFVFVSSTRFVYAWCPEDVPTDSVHTSSIRDVLLFAEMNLAVGIVENREAVVFESGLAVRKTIARTSQLSFTLLGGLLRIRDSLIIGSITAKLLFDHTFLNIADFGMLTYSAALNYDTVSVTQNNILPLLTGLKLQVPLGTEQWRRQIPADFMLVVAYGYDAINSVSREVMNVGFRVNDLIYLSFDVASLWKNTSPVFNVARI